MFFAQCPRLDDYPDYGRWFQNQDELSPPISCHGNRLASG